jgi:hypothetical protein
MVSMTFISGRVGAKSAPFHVPFSMNIFYVVAGFIGHYVRCAQRVRGGSRD